jgi:hypothetical protein
MSIECGLYSAHEVNKPSAKNKIISNDVFMGFLQNISIG